jgi:DNA repair exonuclease SbcCD nuclease subunit
MKLIHTADLHLDSQLSAHLDKDRAKMRRAEILDTFRRMVAYAARENVSAILISGDLFDTKSVRKSTQSMVLSEVTGHPGITFFYLRGNHDEDSFIESLEGKIPENLRLFGPSWVSYECAEDPRVVITGAEFSEAHPELYTTLSLDPDRLNIVMMHGQEVSTGSRNDSDVIRMRELRYRNIDYLALGHVHSYREWPLDSRGTAVYPGCLEGRGFDEAGTKGFMLLETQEGSREIRRIFVPFSKRTLFRVETDLTGVESTGEAVRRMEEAITELSVPSDSMVEVVFKGSRNAEDEFDPMEAEAALSGRFFFSRVKDETKLSVDYASYEKDESLKGEFIRTVRDMADLSEEEKSAVIRYGIQALRGEEIQ